MKRLRLVTLNISFTVLLSALSYSQQEMKEAEFGWARWSPDGSSVVASVWRTNQARHSIVVLPVQTGTARTLAEGPHPGVSPTWSPDGRQVSYVVTRADGTGSLWTVNSDGTDAHVVGDAAWIDLVGGYCWTSDSKHFLFFDARNLRRYFVMDLAGNRQDIALPNATLPMHGIEWSPDRSRIAFSTSDTRRLHIAGPHAEQPRLVTRSLETTWETWPSWSPNADKLLYTASPIRSGKESVWSVRPDGSDNQLRIADGARAQYSPDGRRILYLQGRKGSYYERICLANAEGSQATALAGEGSSLSACR